MQLRTDVKSGGGWMDFVPEGARQFIPQSVQNAGSQFIPSGVQQFIPPEVQQFIPKDVQAAVSSGIAQGNLSPEQAQQLWTCLGTSFAP